MFTTFINSLSQPSDPGRPSRQAAGGGIVVLVLIIIAVFAETAIAAAPVKLSTARAERAARVAVAPLPVETTRCVSLEARRGRERKLCVLRHPDVADQVCTSWVIVTAPRRTKIQTRHICFPDLVFDGISPRGVKLSASSAESLAQAAEFRPPWS